MIEIEWDPKRRHRRKPPSRMHAVWNQFRGRIMGNEQLIRKGNREARRVVAYKKALAEAQARQTARRQARERERGKKQFHLPFFNKRHYKSHYYADGTVEIRERHHPFLHPHHKTKHPHYGIGYQVAGFLTGDKRKRDKGKTMRDIAHRERTIARRRKQKELKAFGHAMRTKHRY